VYSFKKKDMLKTLETYYGGLYDDFILSANTVLDGSPER
jgi:hypothetical protein